MSGGAQFSVAHHGKAFVRSWSRRTKADPTDLSAAETAQPLKWLLLSERRVGIRTGSGSSPTWPFGSLRSSTGGKRLGEPAVGTLPFRTPIAEVRAQDGQAADARNDRRRAYSGSCS
jgi:hypothetical protein